MQTIISDDYAIYFNDEGYQFLNKFLKSKGYSKIFILVDSNSNRYCLSTFLDSFTTNSVIEIIEFKGGEKNKNIEHCNKIWDVLIEKLADRKALIINLGGGVVTDLGGFIAATFKRGIDFINVPTTLLGMVDASIGGKNGINYGNLKNQIGTITISKMVLVDTRFLDSLPNNELLCGLSEMLKHGLIYDKNHWQKCAAVIKFNNSNFESLIYESILIKNEIVSKDLTENGIRKSLNFGHTLGHAIESYCLENERLKTLLHGEAIAVGMILGSHISLQKKLISENEYFEIKKVINNIFAKVIFNLSDIKSIISLINYDKKNEYGGVRFVLLEGIGKTLINEVVANKLIYRAFNDYLSS